MSTIATDFVIVIGENMEQPSDVLMGEAIKLVFVQMQESYKRSKWPGVRLRLTWSVEAEET
jgi:hypothetical protein